MIVFLMFLGIVLSIVQANGWFIVPNLCIVFCYVMSFFSWLIYSYAKGLGEELSKKIKGHEGKGNEYNKTS